MATLLGNKNVGDTVKIKENGVDVNYIIVHKGLPSILYDNSCDGVWVLREFAYIEKPWWEGVSNNDYENSTIKAWLNDEFLNSIDPDIREAIKQVKIPFKKGKGNDTSSLEQYGANGLSCKVFLLSGNEVGFPTTENEHTPVDGEKLDYFLNGLRTEEANAKRICYNSAGSAVIWWLRSANKYNNSYVLCPDETGSFSPNQPSQMLGKWVRPAFILPSDLYVNEVGAVEMNKSPEITANKSGDLGTLTAGFDVSYSVKDADGDAVTVTEQLDSATVRSFQAAHGKTETYSLQGKEWLKVTNGSHTFKISAADGMDTAEHTLTFTRNKTELSVTPEYPFIADDSITACKLRINGSIPDDAVCKYEVTNNALDGSPTWEDCTEEVKAERGYVFKNTGSAFSFRVSIKRGSSGQGGYITKIWGGYE